MKKFPWGQVIEKHQIGPYEIWEFHPRVYKDGRCAGKIDETKTELHGFIDGKDAGESWNTLDDALVGLIVRRAVGPNHRQIAYHFCAGLEAIKQEADQ